MSDQFDGSDNDGKKNVLPAGANKPKLDKLKFGSLSPLTAAQVVAILIKSDIALGACGACGGPCGPCY